MANRSGVFHTGFSVFDRGLAYLEKTVTLPIVSVGIGSILMGLAMIYVRPATRAVYHGVYYSRLAYDPLQAENPNAYRLLTPFVAYILRMTGDRFIILNLFIALLVLAACYYYCRRHDYAPSLSLVIAAMLAFTMPTLFTVYFGGYTDSTTYLLIILMLIAGRRPTVFWTLFLLALLNRESVVFLLPFLVLWHRYLLGSKEVFLRSVLIGPAAALLIYVAFRVFIASQTNVLHNATYYFAPMRDDPFYWLREVIWAYPIGAFSVFKLVWIVPIAAFIIAIRQRKFEIALLVVLPIILSAAQSLLALDTSRMLAMSFPSILIAADMLREKVGDHRLAAAVFLLVIVNLAVPQVYVTSNSVLPMEPLCSLQIGCTLEP